MFGAPFGACTGCGNCAGSESWYVRPTLPGKWKSGRGRTLGVSPAGDGVEVLAEDDASEGRQSEPKRPLTARNALNDTVALMVPTSSRSGRSRATVPDPSAEPVESGHVPYVISYRVAGPPITGSRDDLRRV